MTAGSSEDPPPTGVAPTVRFSIIAAVYNVARFLPDFIDSVENQTFPLERVEVIAIDDGSDDDSLVLLKEWAQRQSRLVTVLAKESGGPESARNLGLDHARGQWVTFADPDDMLDPGQLEAVDSFLRNHDGVSMIATNRLVFDERGGEVANTHPLRSMFEGGDQLVDLRRFPEYFCTSASAGYFRNDLIQRAALRFDSLIQPIIEDGHFCINYLLASDAPLIGFLNSGRYIDRRRADGTSKPLDSARNSGRDLAAPRYGYLDLLEQASEATGYAPEWLQNLLLYDLSWHFTMDSATSSPTAARGDAALKFVQALREIAKYLDPVVVESFKIRRFDRVWRDIIIHGLVAESWVTPYVVVKAYDPAKNQAEIAYRFVGEPPVETVLHRGIPVVPAHGKIRRHDYFEHALLKERTAWVPAKGTLRVLLNGRPTELLRAWPGRATTAVRPAQLEAWFERGATRRGRARRPGLSRRDAAVVRLARTRVVQRYFGKAWVLMDRVDDADDNGERLFRHLRKHRRDVNAWFVLERGSADWKRLKNDGFKRLIPYGSLRWRLLMLNCVHLASSHLYTPVRRPLAITKLAEPTWKFTFLQHGVIKDDLSRWLNTKPIDLFVTSTPGEHGSIVDDDTPYVFSSKEVKMTGLPRFDRLRELGMSTGRDERDLILVCPTWRNWLNEPLAPQGHRRVVTADFFDSEYAQMWLAFLADDGLRQLVEEQHLRVGFQPHPNIQPVLSQLPLPPHVAPLTYAGQDVQRLKARAAVMVTDYSSTAFDAAYIDRPVVYFQFDAERMLSGHTSRLGYFDYATDGFGPVSETVAELVSDIRAIVTSGNKEPAPEYQRRMEETFPMRDGHCCERVIAAMQELRR